ncbi:MAG: hypothetical protein OEV30_10860 [Ignavibacteria bacterium]|nr:hypothetical protein [Ignavibacteria bacterium]
MLKPQQILPVLLLAGLLACEPPGEIQIRQYASGIDVTSLVEPDTVFGFSPIDSSALLPRDQIGFDGSLVLNSVRHDGGDGILQFSFAKAFIGDMERPVIGTAGHLGFHGFHLGTILLNGIPLIERPHLVPGIDQVVVAGFEYVAGPVFTYLPGTTYTWSVDSIGGSGVTIEAPEIIEVSAPAGGSIISRDEPLHLEWSSEGEVVIIVSHVTRIGRPRPMLHLRPWHDGYAVVSPKILGLLTADGTYLLTFLRANREELAIDRPFMNGTLLVQAASVHNIIVQLR